MNNKGKRNLWLVVSLIAVVALTNRITRLINGDIEWWQTVSALVIAAFAVRFFLCYRRAVRAGNLDKDVNPLKKR